MKYSVTLLENGEREKLVLESRGDLPRHVALKLLAYVLYRHSHNGLPLMIERRVGQRHKPDLVATDPETGRVSLWIDCGQIETDRLGRIAARNPKAQVLVVKATARDAMRYAEAAEKDLPPLGRAGAADSVTILGFDPDFVDYIAESLRGTNTLAITTRTESHLALTLGEFAQKSALHTISLPARTL